MLRVSYSRLQVDKLKTLGIPPGPLYAKLKRGESITSPEGFEIVSSDVVGPSRSGRKVVILGDTCDSSAMIPIAETADVLVHEATNENAHRDKCRENGHSTPEMAASFCHLIRARKLILTHFSQRYKRVDENCQENELHVDLLEKEASEELKQLGSTAHVSAADDLKVYLIPPRTDYA